MNFGVCVVCTAPFHPQLSNFEDEISSTYSEQWCRIASVTGTLQIRNLPMRCQPFSNLPSTVIWTFYYLRVFVPTIKRLSGNTTLLLSNALLPYSTCTPVRVTSSRCMHVAIFVFCVLVHLRLALTDPSPSFEEFNSTGCL